MADELPHFFSMGGWQRTDDDHPPGQGTLAYRVVYKTLKTYLPEAELNMDNLVLRAGHGSVDRGGVKLGEILPTRRPHQWLLPQGGTVEFKGEEIRFQPREAKNFEFRAWQESIDEVFFVEVILHTTEQEPARRLAEGRRRLGYLKTFIELALGARVLYALLAEELGEVFPDGHFNRNLRSDQVANEWQAPLGAVFYSEFEGWLQHSLKALVDRPIDERERLSLACDWYWRSTETADLVTEYLELWFVVEAIAMPNTTDIRPARERLATALGGTEADWRQLVGRHFGRRSNLVHGQGRRDAGEPDLESLRDIVQALLEAEFGFVNVERAHRLRTSAGISPAA